MPWLSNSIGKGLWDNPFWGLLFILKVFSLVTELSTTLFEAYRP